jgi:ubiquinone biosynthesis protein
VESYLQQVFDAGIFHADPHQGNIMVSGGKVHWIDFGMIGEITEADISSLEKIVVGMLSADTDSMADGILTIGKCGAGCDRNRLKDDLELFSAKYMSVSSLSDIDFSSLLGEVVDLADRHHIMMPGKFTMLVRSFLTIEGVMEQLCPELNLFDVISNKLMDRMKKSFSLEKEILNLGQGVLDVGKKVTRIPQLIAESLSDIVKGRLKINLELTGYEELMKKVDSKINDIVLVIVGCVLFSGGCRLAATEISPVLPNGMPLIALTVLMIGSSLLIYALKRILKKKP